MTLPWNTGPKTYIYEDIISVFGPVGDAGSILGVLFVGWFAYKVGKKPAFLILFSLSLALTLAFYWVKPNQLSWLFVLQFLGSGTGGPLSVLLWAMYADTATIENGKKAAGPPDSFSQLQRCPRKPAGRSAEWWSGTC